MGKIESARAAMYIVAQLAGAAAGAGVLRLALPAGIWKSTNLGATAVSHGAGITNGKAVLLEAVLTFFLVFTVFAAAIDDRGVFKSLGGMTIGLVAPCQRDAPFPVRCLQELQRFRAADRTFDASHRDLHGLPNSGIRRHQQDLHAGDSTRGAHASLIQEPPLLS